jgi:hypothetical protein
MKRQFFGAALILLLAGFTAPAMARDSGPHVSKAVAVPLEAALKLAEAKDFTTALSKVREAQTVPDRTPFDDFKINEVLGFVAINLNDHATAREAFEAMADSPAVEIADKKDALHNAILLANENKEYDRVVKYAGMAQQAGPLDDIEIGALSQTYFYQGNYSLAQSTVQKAINNANAAGQIPGQGLLDVLLTSQVKQKDQTGAAQTLELLAQDYGKADDWGELLDLSLGTKGMQDLDVLNIYRLRLVANATMSAEDYLVMSGIAEHLGYPVEALEALEHGQSKGISSGAKTAAQLATLRPKAAQDRRTIASFDTLAQARKTGDYDLKLAQTYFGYGRYGDAEAAARRALAKGGVPAAQVQTVLGMALAMEGKNADASQALAQAGGTPAMDKVVHLWSLYVGRKYSAAAQ